VILAPEKLKRGEVKDAVEVYSDLYSKVGADKRKENYQELVNTFYDLVTSFYEYGWGPSFHFAPRKTWESFETSIRRHEMFLAHHLRLYKGMTAVDLGCGVGGPARCIAVFSEAKVVGVNNNEYQVSRAKKLTADVGLSDQVTFVKADFMHLPQEDETFDAAYAIEATCHAPDRVACFSEAYRVLKPGAYFGVYEWVVTDKYDPTNEAHVAIKEGIEKGNGLPELATAKEVEDAMEESGFKIVDSRDLSPSADAKTPWFLPLAGSLSISGFKHTRWGRFLTNRALKFLEWVHIAPKGTTAVSNILCDTANQLVAGGEQDIFTPMWFLVARKPGGDQSEN